MFDALPTPFWHVAVAVTHALLRDPEPGSRATRAVAGHHRPVGRRRPARAVAIPRLAASGRACFEAALEALPARGGHERRPSTWCRRYFDRWIARRRSPADDRHDAWRASGALVPPRESPVPYVDDLPGRGRPSMTDLETDTTVTRPHHRRARGGPGPHARPGRLPHGPDEQCTPVSPLMSPFVWDLAHIGNYEELWLLREIDGRPAIDPALDDLYNAFEHPRWERPSLPILGPAEARAYDAKVRDDVLDAARHRRLSATDPIARCSTGASSTAW